MPSVFTIAGTGGSGSGCRCTKNGRTFCKVAKSKKHPTGYTFVGLGDPRAMSCRRSTKR